MAMEEAMEDGRKLRENRLKEGDQKLHHGRGEQSTLNQYQLARHSQPRY